MRFYYLNSIASRSCPTLEMAAGKERWWGARRDGGWQGEMVDGKERWWMARRDRSRQGETAAGKERWQWARRDGSGKERHFLAEEGQQCLKCVKMRYAVQAVV